MKRMFALALVLAMALSMMVMTASAAPAGVDFSESACSEHDGSIHVYSLGTKYFDIIWFVHSYYYSNGNVIICNEYSGEDAISVSSFSDENYSAGWYYFNGIGLVPCNGVHAGDVPAPAPQPQPKTGVMDTLPVWFGVMAVSACAYVLTSKKKVF